MVTTLGAAGTIIVTTKRINNRYLVMRAVHNQATAAQSLSTLIAGNK
jgi:hypothetical protein